MANFKNPQTSLQARKQEFNSSIFTSGASLAQQTHLLKEKFE
jgi:hypothetical protein